MSEQTTKEPAQLKDQVQTGIQMRADVVRDVIKNAEAMGRVDAEGGDLIYWLYSYGQENRLTWAQLAEKVRMSQTTVHQVLHGNYQAADWSNVIKAIRIFQRAVQEDEKRKDIGFIQTSIAKTVFDVCGSALNLGMPGYIYGASQIGKTTALLEFQRTHNHGRTKYLRLGSRWTKSRVVRELARVCKCFSRTATIAELEDRILGSLTNYNLLIIDEFHLAIETTSDQNSKEIVEYFREVYDNTKCGMVIAATKVGLAGLEQGKNKMLFDQFRRRGIVKVVLPDVPPLKDINAIARSFELPVPSGRLLADVKLLLKMRGLNVFIKYLQAAYALCKSSEQEFGWDAYEAVEKKFAALANMPSDY